MKELTKEEIIELAKEISIGVKDSELEWITRRFASACKNTNCLEYIDTLEELKFYEVNINKNQQKMSDFKEVIPTNLKSLTINNCDLSNQKLLTGITFSEDENSVWQPENPYSIL